MGIYVKKENEESDSEITSKNSETGVITAYAGIHSEKGDLISRTIL